MPKKGRVKILETKYFSFVIGFLIILIVLALSHFTTIFSNLDLKVNDFHFFLKNSIETRITQEGVKKIDDDLRISNDISIVGIDFATLSDFGKWPFSRYHFADLLNAFSRIKKQNMRETGILLDVFFMDMDTKAADDALLRDAIEDSGRVFLETVLRQDFSTSVDEAEQWGRMNLLEKNQGHITKVAGDWQSVPEHLGFEAPLKPFAAASRGHGYANYVQDPDDIYRKQMLVAKISLLERLIPIEELSPDLKIDESSYERLCWMDSHGDFHPIKYPLTAETISKLRKILPQRSPPVIEDLNNDGDPETKRFVVRLYKDSFSPAITLSMALAYFNKRPEDLEVSFGKYIRIPSPQHWDPESSTWQPYTIQLTNDVVNKDGTISKPARTKVLDEIRIPIDKNGQMRINYMGPRSSESGEGVQTYPVRSMSVYANMAKPSDQSLWRNSMAVPNQLILVGAFSRGMAQDEKPTPFGMMYGIEMHANALNTIVMNNFIHTVPIWLNSVIAAFLILLACLLASRMPTMGSLFSLIALVVLEFATLTILFEQAGLLLDFSASAIGVLISFISIIAYRAMTEEKDKRILKDMFGKYVSPKVVDQLVQNPPELGGVDKELTVFFSDIRGFSTMSENMSPQELVNHLNIYLAKMTDLILDYGGTLDKYIGDAIMAFWGAPLPQPDHASLACDCALVQMEVLRELNEHWPPEKRINIGIGINSGVMTVGNMGSSLRMNYTLMGDNVNLGSRLEGTNKEYGTNIIISENTHGLVSDQYIFRELDNVRVKGKNKPVGIYELVAKV